MSYNLNTTNNIPSQGVTREYNGKQFLVIHSTSDLNATATNEATYFNREWESRQTFVQDIIDDVNLYHIYPYGNRAWGAGNINSYAYGQIEICEFSDAERSKQAISNAIVLARNIVNDAKSKGVTLEIVSHHEASNQFGGSDHTDPDEYFSRFGYTMDWFRSQVNQTTLQPQPQPKQKIDVDGYWGLATWHAMQDFVKQSHDDVISGQSENNKFRLAGITMPIDWSGDGSQTIVKWQKWLGIDSDGIMGQDFIGTLQIKLTNLGYYHGLIDKQFDHPSSTIKALQQMLNERLN